MKMYNEKDDAVGWSVSRWVEETIMLENKEILPIHHNKMQCPYSSLCDHKSCNHHSIHEKTNPCSMTGSRFDQGCPICESLNSLSDFIKEEEMVI